MSNIRLDVAQLEHAIASLLAQYPEMAEDDVLRADMLEGATDIDGVLSRLVDLEREAKAMAGAIKERIGDLTERKARYERQQEAWRKLILHIMEYADQRKVTLPEATLSIMHRAPAPIIADEAALPDECVKLVRTPDKATIKAWCEAGNVPDGVVMSNGSTSLTIRSK